MGTYHKDIHADFMCKHCGYYVNTQTQLSGVVNRNHCPYCLHSQHVDLFNPGDRLSACKALMVPIGLTFKRSRDKYAPDQHGELMLIHRCVYCSEFSINRIAADDDTSMLLAVFRKGTKAGSELLRACGINGIRLLDSRDHYLVQSQLFGSSVDLKVIAVAT